MKTIRTTAALSDAEAAALAGVHLDDTSFDTLIAGEDVTVFKPDGSPLLVYIANALPADVCRSAFAVFRRVRVGSVNRGLAAGRLDDADTSINGLLVATRTRTRFRPRRRDGRVSRTTYARKVPSSVIGYLDRSTRDPYCRQTSFNARDAARFARAVPFICAIDRVFATYVPDRYAAQRAAIDRTSPDFVIADTAFTTLPVNHNWATAVHRDSGDLRAGFGVTAVLDAGEYTGGYLVFPQYRVAVDMRARGVLLADVHEWHGNTPIVGLAGAFMRVSIVCYMRECMTACGSAAEELARGRRAFEV